MYGTSARTLSEVRPLNAVHGVEDHIMVLLFIVAYLLTPFGIGAAAIGCILWIGERRRPQLRPWSEAMFFISGVLCLPGGLLIMFG